MSNERAVSRGLDLGHGFVLFCTDFVQLYIKSTKQYKTHNIITKRINKKIISYGPSLLLKGFLMSQNDVVKSHSNKCLLNLWGSLMTVPYIKNQPIKCLYEHIHRKKRAITESFPLL